MSGLQSHLAQLDDITKAMHRRWEQARILWNDPIAWHFEKQYWAPLDAQALAVQRELEQLLQALAQARQHVK